MSDLPRGEVTFLFTDIVGFGLIAEDHPGLLSDVKRMHAEIARRCVTDHSGAVVSMPGDSLFAAFSHAPDALGAALSIMRAVAQAKWPGALDVQLRAALNSGLCEPEDGDYHDRSVNRCAYLLARTKGGEILVSDRTHRLVIGQLPANGELLDLGTLRLKHGIPLQAHRFLHPDLPTLELLVQGRLPHVSTRFIGREREVRDVESALDDSRLVTLIGAGGTGKTRLALRVATRAHEAFRDGALWTDLTLVRDTSLVFDVVMESLDSTPLDNETVEESIVRELGPRQLVLVLDNAEHVLSACVELVRLLLRDTPDIRILITSRSPLHVEGERVVHVPTLSYPSAELVKDKGGDGDSRWLRRFDAIELFLSRAQSRWPSFTLDSSTAPDVMDICQHLEGHPLAIELAAAHVGVLPLRTIMTQVRDCLALPRHVSRMDDARHETLEAALDWSQALLQDDERDLFERLSVFEGGFDLEAVAAACGLPVSAADEPAVIHPVVGLADKSMIETIDGGARYRQLEPIRQYAQRGLAARGELETVRQLHALHYLEMAEEAARQLRGPDQSQWLTALDREQANIRRALEHLQSVTQADLPVRLASALWRYWYIRNRPHEGERWLAPWVAETSTSPCSPPVLAGALHAAGTLAIVRGHHEVARSRLERCLAIRETLDTPSATADTRSNLGIVAFELGNYAEAREHYEASLAIHRGLEAWASVATTILNLCLVAKVEGRFDEALRFAEEGLAVERKGGSPTGVATGLTRVGEIKALMGDRVSATHLLEDALRIYRGEGNSGGEQQCLRILGNIAWEHLELQAADDIFQQSLRSAQEHEHERDIAISLINLALVRIELGDLDRAAALLAEAEPILVRIRHRAGRADALAAQADLMLRTAGRQAQARETLLHCMRIGVELLDWVARIQTIERFVEVFAHLGQDSLAMELAAGSTELRHLGSAPRPPLFERRVSQALGGKLPRSEINSDTADAMDALRRLETMIEGAP